MKLRAIAKATDRSNTVGAVELMCAPQGLLISYLGAGAWGEGYAVGALTHGTLITVPYAELREARLDGDQLYLEVDQRLTPLNKLVLSNFSLGNSIHPIEQQRRERIIWLASLVGALIVAVLSALTFPKLAPRAGAAAMTLVGLFGGAGVLLLGLLSQRLLNPTPNPTFLRESFITELERYIPKLPRSGQAPEPESKPELIPSFGRLLPRTTAGIIITLSACLLGAVVTSSYVMRSGRASAQAAAFPQHLPNHAPPSSPEPKPPLIDDAVPLTASTEAQAAAAEPPAPADPVAGNLRVGAGCSCPRSESLLWASPIPKLSILAFNQRTITRGNRELTSLDVAAVNNSDKPLEELSLNLQFYHVDLSPPYRRSRGDHRSVYYQGPLDPGQAIKWAVEARGNQFDVQNPVEGSISPSGEGAASTQAFMALLNANHRPVRLHAARVLAYLGDPRARQAAADLRDALREDEAPFLDRVIRASLPLRVCQLQVEPGGNPRQIQACVYNGSAEARERVGMKLRALSGQVTPEQPTAAPPLIDSERIFELDAPLAKESGVLVRGALPVNNSAEPLTFEAWADRADLLR